MVAEKSQSSEETRNTTQHKGDDIAISETPHPKYIINITEFLEKYKSSTHLDTEDELLTNPEELQKVEKEFCQYLWCTSIAQNLWLHKRHRYKFVDVPRG